MTYWLGGVQELLNHGRPVKIEGSSEHDELDVIHENLSEDTGYVILVCGASQSGADHKDDSSNGDYENTHDTHRVSSLVRAFTAFIVSTARVANLAVGTEDALVASRTRTHRVIFRSNHAQTCIRVQAFNEVGGIVTLPPVASCRPYVRASVAESFITGASFTVAG